MKPSDTPKPTYFGNSRRPPPHMRYGRFMVEGRSITTAEIASELGIGMAAARSRMKAAQAKTGPVTWAKLGVK